MKQPLSLNFYYSAFLAFEGFKIAFTTIPKIKAQAIEEMVTGPNVSCIPPIPVTKIAATTNKFFESSRSTFLNILKPDTAIKP